MHTFLALYRGDTVGSAKLVTICTDPDLVAAFANEMLKDRRDDDDPAQAAMTEGRRAALRIIQHEQQR